MNSYQFFPQNTAIFQQFTLDNQSEEMNDMVIETSIPGNDNMSIQSNQEMICSSPQIVNVVSTFKLNGDVELKEIAQKSWNVEYNPKKFSALIMRIAEPKTTAKIFPKGKVVITGARNIEESLIACRKVVKKIRKVGYSVKLVDFSVQNLVASAKFPFEISLMKLAKEHTENTKYNPDRFPGLSFKLSDLNLKVNIFRNGNVVILGGKNEQTINRAYEQLHDILIDYKYSE